MCHFLLFSKQKKLKLYFLDIPEKKVTSFNFEKN